MQKYVLGLGGLSAQSHSNFLFAVCLQNKCLRFERKKERKKEMLVVGKNTDNIT